MRADARVAVLCAGLWLVLLVGSLLARPLLPIDETRYAAVAWEMWLRGDWLVPHLNGQPYSHKPPLLFWLIQLAWHGLGVRDWAARSVPPLFALLNLFLAAALARRLWPQRPAVVARVPLLLLGTTFWALFGTLLMFDMLVASFTLLGLLGLADLTRRGGRRGWGLFALAIGGGVLAKGPVILLYLLPTALLAPWWLEAGQRPPRWRDWYGGLAAAVALGAALALAWALPAAWWGGAEYRQAILWGQTSGRMVESFAHARPWWWYLPLLPLLLLPWTLWPPLWRSLRGLRLEPGVRFCLAGVLPGLVTFSLISGKQVHYLIPLFPALALLAARALEDAPGYRRDLWPAAALLGTFGLLLALVPLLEHWHRLPDWVESVSPLWGLGLLALAGLLAWRGPLAIGHQALALLLATVTVLLVVHLGILRPAHAYYDVAPMSERLAALQEQGVPIAHLGNYHGQFQFSGRLIRPLTELEHPQLADWLAGHANGKVLLYARHMTPQLQVRAELWQPYRGRYLLLLPAAALSADPGLVPP